MATKLVRDEDVEVDLELCLSLGGPFKKTEKPKPKENLADGKSNGLKDISVDLNSVTTKREINATKSKRETTQQQQINREEEKCKRMRTERDGVTNGVVLDLKFSKMGNGYGLNKVSDISTAGSPVSKSSSDVSDPSSSSHQQGGSCDFVENSGNTKPVNKICTGTEETGQSTDGLNEAVVVVAKEIGKPPKPRFNGNVDGGKLLLPFAKMPCVTSTGDGPEGKTVNGFLNQYSKSGISIICVCHGTSFSPAEFIVHAGGTQVSHPLRHITVVPSASVLETTAFRV